MVMIGKRVAGGNGRANQLENSSPSCSPRRQHLKKKGGDLHQRVSANERSPK